jgi:DNA-binding FrmR family transcriptional regulator
MAHLIKDKKKLIARVRRIQGQLGSVEKALDDVIDCGKILQTLAACRGALDGLMSEVFEGHIRMHIIDPERHPTTEQSKAAQELIDVAKAYLK